MSFTNSQRVVELARQRLGWAVAEIPRIQAMLPGALKELALVESVKPGARQYFLTDPTATTLNLDAAGKGDLSAIIDSRGVLLERLEFGEITHPSSRFPLKPIANTGSAALGSNYSGMGFIRYWVTGKTIYTTKAAVAVLAFAVPRIVSIAELESNEEEPLVNILVVMGEGPPPPSVYERRANQG